MHMHDLIAITETWLKPSIDNCELFQGNVYQIHRRDREHGVRGGGVMLAVREPLISVRRQDLDETNSELLVCEIKPEDRRKFLCAVFYRPPNTGVEYMKEFKRFLRKVSLSHFSQVVVLGDFNMPDIDWTTGVPNNNELLYLNFAKTIHDNQFLWQLIDVPTRDYNILDLVLTNIPHKFRNIEVFQDIIKTDHTLIEFSLDFNIAKKPQIIRQVYNFKKADLHNLKATLAYTPWDIVFDESSIDNSLQSWIDLFLTIVDQYIPKVNIKNNMRPWIDKDAIHADYALKTCYARLP